MATQLYGLIWRWHFFAGVAAVPILLVISLTGALYVFQPELEAWTHPELNHVTPSGPRRSLDDIVAAVPRCSPSGATVDERPDRPVVVYCAGKDDQTYYVDPYRAELLGEQTWKRTFFGVVFALHWELLLGDPGRIAIEWATSWTLLLALSGLALWWPRGSRRTGGVLWPRRRLQGRPWLRDLHAVIGAWFAPVVCVIAISGLFWTLWAGDERWHHIAEDEAHLRGHHPPKSVVVPGAARIGWQAAVDGAALPAIAHPRAYYVAPPEKPKDVYSLYLWDPIYQRPSLGETVWVDAYSGERRGGVAWDDRSAIGKVDFARYPIHVGAFLGLPGRVLAGLASLALAFACVTGPWMWFKRQRNGRLAPPPPRAQRVPPGLIAALGLFGVLLPAIGYTLLVLAALAGIEWCWRRRRRPLADR
jgi:uncharacterized iron-regulated membrane protein